MKKRPAPSAIIKSYQTKAAPGDLMRRMWMTMKNLNLPKILLVLCAAVILLMGFVGDEDNGQDDNSHIFVYDKIS